MKQIFRDLGPPFQVDDDQVCVRSGDDRAFLRIETENPRGVLASDLRQPFNGDAAFVHEKCRGPGLESFFKWSASRMAKATIVQVGLA